MIGSRPRRSVLGVDQPASVILLIGPCGAGKTSALARMRAVLADRAGEIAVLETDTIYQMIDPTWSAYNARRAAICAHVTAMTAAHFLEAGFDWVVVGSNGLQERRDAEEFIARLPEDIDVFSFFLDPSTAAVQARIQGRSHPLDEHKTPEWVAENVAWMRGFHRPETSRIDNSELSVDETVEALHAAVCAGKGLIRPAIRTSRSGSTHPSPRHADAGRRCR